MPRFIEKSGKFFVSTSLKVMYSSLGAHEHIAEISEAKFAQEFLLRRRPHLLLVRDPLARVVSAFADKCRLQPMHLGTNEFVGWQHFHRIHFSHLGLSNEDSDESIRDRFLALTFKEFVRLLPQTMLSEGHLRPQHYLERIRFRGLVPLGSACITDRMSIERLDYDELITPWGIDASVKHNVGTDRTTLEIVDNEDSATIGRLYAKDYKLYKY